MATQEPNVYAGLSVVIGGLMYARPKFFAKVMGELLFWVGEDKMTFGSDYSIWEPKWQVEGFVDWDYPSDEFSDYPRVTVDTKKKILGSQRRQALRHRGSRGVPDRGRFGSRGAGRRSAGRRRSQGVTERAQILAALDQVRDPELDEPVTALGFVSSCAVSAAGDVQVRLRLPTYFCAPNFAFLMVADAYDAVSGVDGVRHAEVILEDHFAVGRHQRRGRGPGRVRPVLRRSSRRGAGRAPDRLRAQGRAGRDRPGLPAPAGRGTEHRRPRRAHPGRRPAVARPGSAALAAGRARSARRRRLAAARRRRHRRGGRRTGAAAAPAPGPADPGQPRGQRQHLRRDAAAPLRNRRDTANWRRSDEGRPVARVQQAAHRRRGPRTQGDGSARRGGQDRRSGRVPHRPAHHPRSVGRAR